MSYKSVKFKLNSEVVQGELGHPLWREKKLREMSDDPFTPKLVGALPCTQNNSVMWA